ncbi:hypothetical protein BT681P2_00033 [Bacteroides phage BT681P2]|nr:hypothetical protein BT681P2_00033 [Bacteroides phage BT681P2]
MAMTFTDLNNLNINSLSDVISLTVGLVGEMERGATVLAGLDNKTPIVTFTAADKALRKSVGCAGVYEYNSLVDNVKYYDFQPIELPIVVCLQDLWGKMVAKGIHLSDDFDSTQLAGFMAAEVLKVLEADLLRLAWLDGTLTGNAAYSIFKNGGFLKQMTSSAEAIRTLTLDDNATTGVEATMKNLIDDQRPDQKENSEFFVTSNVMRLFKNLVQKKDNTTAQQHFEEGKPVYTLEGYKINELPHVSASMIADVTDQKAFIAFTPKTNIQIALEDSSVNIKPFIQDAKDRKYYSTTVFAADAMVAIPKILKLATTAK